MQKKTLKLQYFFQNFETDDIIRVHSQLRNLNTTALLKDEFGTTFKKGIFIDIFILDNLPDNKNEIDKLIKIKKNIKNFYLIQTITNIETNRN